MNPILVTAFVYQSNHYQDLDFYIENGKKILQQDFNKVIFIDPKIKSYFTEFENQTNRFIEFSIKDIYLFDKIQTLRNGVHGNPNKDTNEFFSIMCNKTEFIRKAIDLQLFDCDYYFWIDFGIYKIFDSNICIERLNRKYEKIRIGSIWGLEHSQRNNNIFKNVSWYFAGGVFGGNKSALLTFADLMKEQTLSFIEQNGYLIWEVNLWYFIYNQNKELFMPYICDHNNSIVNNY